MQGLLKQSLRTEAQGRVLLVDDDPAFLQALPQLFALRLRSVQLDLADSVRAAQEQMQQYAYDAIVSDIRMPGDDGFALLAWAQQQQPDVPVLLITGHGDHQLAIRALRAGAYDYILKPVDRDDLVATLYRALQTRQLRQSVHAQQLALEQHASSLAQQVDERTQDLMRSNAELSAANDAKELMLRMVSHELAGPITSLKGMQQLTSRQLQRGTPRDQIEQAFQLMARSLARIERLTQDLHDAAHIQTQRFLVKRTPCGLEELCQQVLSEFTNGAAPTPSRQGASGANPISAEVDPQRISQVLLNLLSNARKYSPANTPIIVQLQQQASSVAIKVCDQGIGIPSNALNRIYDQFYQVPESEVQNGPANGLGLGLYIANAIVEQHNGQLQVESIVNQGTTFTLVLPTSAESSLTVDEQPSTTPPTSCLTWTFTQTDLSS
jgi:signal transduction histidine kinase